MSTTFANACSVVAMHVTPGYMSMGGSREATIIPLSGLLRFRPNHHRRTSIRVHHGAAEIDEGIKGLGALDAQEHLSSEVVHLVKLAVPNRTSQGLIQAGWLQSGSQLLQQLLGIAPRQRLKLVAQRPRMQSVPAASKSSTFTLGLINWIGAPLAGVEMLRC